MVEIRLSSLNSLKKPPPLNTYYYNAGFIGLLQQGFGLVYVVFEAGGVFESSSASWINSPIDFSRSSILEDISSTTKEEKVHLLVMYSPL